MSQGVGNPAGARALMVRLSVPSHGGLRMVATEVAARIALYLGGRLSDAESMGTTLEGLAARVAPAGSESDITFEFNEVDRALLIRARCDGRSSEARYPLTA